VSNSLAIAAVTATLRHLLDAGVNSDVPGTNVTARPLDAARTNITGNQVNVFLYQVVPNAAWRNQPLPAQARNGETAQPPLALDLHYLVTAYGDNDDEVTSNRLLGGALSVLHDHALLQPNELQSALPGSDVHQQVERVRITPHALSVEDISKLWTAFQTEYRVSATFEASVVLIESTRPRRSPLPVLRRGPQDEGVRAVAGAGPTLTRMAPDVGRPGLLVAARLGDDLILDGSNLDATGRVRITHPRIAAPVLLTPVAQGSSLRVHLPTPVEDATAQAAWAPGLATVALVLSRPSLPTIASNEAPLLVAPTITVTPITAPPGNISVQVTCSPRVRDGQTVLLLFGDRQVAPLAVNNPADPTLPTAIDFAISSVAAGVYVVRLRVDGVDSLPVSMPPPGQPLPDEFDPSQQVTVA